MDNHKFAFIICSNNSIMLNECIFYIHQLIIPKNYDIEILTVENASSITSAYNEAMVSCNAKYKIYMHQDVFILNRNFLNDALSIFLSDPKIGLLGMVGYTKISPDGIMWHIPRCGNLYLSSSAPAVPYPPLDTYSYSLEQDCYSSVALIDGFLMMTAYDIRWDEETLTGWDFYDAFQSINFLENGYRIAVPTQLYPWCLHDSDHFCNLIHYDEFRQCFKQKYHSLLGKNINEIVESMS